MVLSRDTEYVLLRRGLEQYRHAIMPAEMMHCCAARRMTSGKTVVGRVHGHSLRVLFTPIISWRCAMAKLALQDGLMN